MKVPLLDLRGQHLSLRAQLLEALEGVIDSQQFVLGPQVETLEQQVAKYSQTKFAVGCASGSDALLLALMTLDLKADDEVITTPFTFFATAGSIARLGARPRFVDIDPQTYKMDPSRVEAAITPRTRAIMAVHLYGQCADMDPILEISKRHELPLVEDAAQAIGAEDRGRRAGSMAHIGCFSFYPSKNLGAAGDAGAIVCNNAELAARIRICRQHGMEPRYHHQFIGGNFRLDEMQAAILNVKLPYLAPWSAARRTAADFYRAEFSRCNLAARVILPLEPYRDRVLEDHIYHQFVIRAEDRDELKRHLAANEIGTEIYYPIPLHLQECFAYLQYKRGDLPEAERAADETLALPIYPELSREAQRFVVEKIAEFYRG